jgi:hypothetical protein
VEGASEELEGREGVGCSEDVEEEAEGSPRLMPSGTFWVKDDLSPEHLATCLMMDVLTLVSQLHFWHLKMLWCCPGAAWQLSLMCLLTTFLRLAADLLENIFLQKGHSIIKNLLVFLTISGP